MVSWWCPAKKRVRELIFVCLMQLLCCGGFRFMFCPLSFVVAGYFSENRLLAGASEHNLLATTHDVGVLTNFGTFALMLETSLQSVDPMLAVSFH